MSDSISFPTVPAPVKVVSADTVFAVLGDPTRRRLLVAMADRTPRRATTLKAAAGKKFDATLKHIIALRDAGFITAQPDPTDKRRQLYTLSPNIKIADTPEGRTMDFGYCVVRVAAAGL
ncbi:MAG: Helix-turn-helix domain [Verrucomicrobiota bacterium]|jgi:predicted transcriptional regulator